MTRDERQDLVIERWKEAQCRATLVAGTGFGKTRTAIKAISRVLSKNPTLDVVVVVPTKILKNQWTEELQKWNLNASVLVLNTAAKKPFKCDFLVIDEAHRANAVSMSRLFDNCSPILILGLTATYERLDGREKEVLDKHCPVCDTITLEETVENGWTSPYTLYKVVLNVDTSEYANANIEFMSHFSFFNFEFDTAMKAVCDLLFRQKLARHMGCDIKEVTAHAFGWKKAMQFRKSFIANHPKKIEIAKKILAYRQNTKAITFNSSIKQCEAYKSGYVVHSKKKDKENKLILEEFASLGPGHVLHNSKVAKEGYDCPGLGLVIVTGFNSDKLSLVQIIGRGIRFEQGKNTEVFVITLQNTQDQKWFHNASLGMDYVEINESDLDIVLKHEKITKITNNKNKLKRILCY